MTTEILTIIHDDLQFLREQKSKPTQQMIILAVRNATNTTIEDLCNPSHKPKFVIARHIAIYLLRYILVLRYIDLESIIKLDCGTMNHSLNTVNAKIYKLDKNYIEPLMLALNELVELVKHG